jgi:hypothetical protein
MRKTQRIAQSISGLNRRAVFAVSLPGPRSAAATPSVKPATNKAATFVCPSGDHHHCRRPKASRRAHWPHRRAAHMGFGDDPPPPCALDRAGRRPLAGRIKVDRLQAQILLGMEVLSALFRGLIEPQDREQGGQTAVPRRSRGPRRCLREGAFRRPRGGTAILVALHASRRDLQPPPDRQEFRGALSWSGSSGVGLGRVKTLGVKNT